MPFTADEYFDIIAGRLKVTFEYEGKPPIVYSRETEGFDIVKAFDRSYDPKSDPVGPGKWNRSSTIVAAELALHTHLSLGEASVRNAVRKAVKFVNDDLKLMGPERVQESTVRTHVMDRLRELRAKTEPEESQAPDLGSE